MKNEPIGLQTLQEIDPNRILESKNNWERYRRWIRSRALFGLVIAAIYLPYYYLFAKTDIRVINNTNEPIHQLNLKTFSFSPKESHAFNILTLQPKQEAKISISHFENGLIRIDYASNISACAYLKHEQCVWHSGEIIYIEPDGRFDTKIAFCKPKKTNKIDRIITGSCPNNDFKIKARGFKPTKAIIVEPIKRVGS